MPRKPQEKPVGVQENGKPIFGYKEKNPSEPCCYSPLRGKPGKRCQTGNPFLSENGRCELHGGGTPKGLASPHYQTGEHSFYRDVLKPEHRAEFDRLMENGAYTSLQEDIATARMRLRYAIEHWEGSDPDGMKDLFKHLEEARAVLEGDYEEGDGDDVLRLIVGAYNEVLNRLQAGQTVERMQEQVRKLIETENRRLKDEQEQISAAKALALFFTLRSITVGHIKNSNEWLKENHPEAYNDPSRPKILRLIAGEIALLLPRRERGAVVIDVEATVTETAIERADNVD